MQLRSMLKSSPLESATPGTSFLQPVYGIRIFAATVIVFTAVTLWLSAVLNLYIDEAYSLHTTDRGIFYAFAQSLTFEQQPPLYFVTLAAWRLINHGLFFARLTSVAYAIATLLVVRDFAKRRIRNAPDWLPPLIVAANPFMLWAATELRVYSLIVLLSATLMSLYFRTFVDGPTTLGKCTIFGCVAIAAVYTQYFFVATLVGFCATTIFFDRRKLRTYLSTMGITVLALLPMLEVVRQQAKDASVEKLLHPLQLEFSMLSAIASFVLPHVWINALDVPTINVAYTIILLTMVVVAAIGIRKNRIVFTLAILTGSIATFFSLIILVAHEPIEMPRHITTIFLPALLTIIAAAAGSFRLPERRKIIGLYLMIFAVCASAEIAHAYHPLVKFGDWSRVSRYLETNAKPSEPIAVFDAESALPIRYSYHGASRIVPIPHEQLFSKFDPRDYAIKSESELQITFPSPSKTTNIVWLVVERPCRNLALGKSCALLQSFVDSRFTVVKVTQFVDTAVYELRGRTLISSAPEANVKTN